MERTILQFNLQNWITVTFIAFTGLALVGLGGSAFKAYREGKPLAG